MQRRRLLAALSLACLLPGPAVHASLPPLPRRRVIVCTDVGGTDLDDFQS